MERTKTPITIEVSHRYSGVDVDEETFQDLLDAIAWRRKPRFLTRGRISRELLKRPAQVSGSTGARLPYAKMKGIGVFDPARLGKHRDPILEAHSDEPQPPTTVHLDWTSTYPHIGFDSAGEYTFAFGSGAPIGGITHARALLEYENARTLHEHGVPTAVPLAVVRYPELIYRDQPMGASITLLPDPEPYRLSEILYLAACRPGHDPEADAYYHRVLNTLEIEGDPTLETTRLHAVQVLAYKIGALIRRWSESGLYRYSSEWSNFEFDFGTGEPLFTDLDSSRPLSELEGQHVPLQIMRDFATVVYRLLSKFGTPTNLNAYTLANLRTFDALVEALRGYFPKASLPELEGVSQKLWRAFIPHLCLLQRHRHAICAGEWSNERRRSYKLDHDLFYSLVITLTFPLFHASDLGAQYGANRLTQAGLLGKAKRYLGDRYEYLCYLME